MAAFKNTDIDVPYNIAEIIANPKTKLYPFIEAKNPDVDFNQLEVASLNTETHIVRYVVKANSKDYVPSYYVDVHFRTNFKIFDQRLGNVRI